MAVPRLVVGLTRGRQEHLLDGSQWRDTSVVLPGETTTSRGFRNVLTGEQVCADSQNGKPSQLLPSFNPFP